MKDKQEKQKPLDKMTAKELRDMALGIGGITGVHAMNKNELVAAIREAKGIEEEPGKGAKMDMRALKEKIRVFRGKRFEAMDAGNRKLADSFKRRISNLKKKTRRAA
jgi:hypothetical protein